MSQTQTITQSSSNAALKLFLNVQPEPAVGDLFLHDPSVVVDMALHRLQKAGVDLIEWRSLLYSRMNVPVMIKDYCYVVPDEQLEAASRELSKIGLPLTTASRFLLKTGGDFQAKGRFYRVTRSTALSSVQHLVIYPLSFSTLDLSECETKPPFHTTPPSEQCPFILVPTQPALYASILRLMLQYPRHCPTTTILQSDLSELIGYDLLQLEDGYVDPEDDAEWDAREVDKRLMLAADIVWSWGPRVWREGEDWMADALATVALGSGSIEYLPHR